MVLILNQVVIFYNFTVLADAKHVLVPEWNHDKQGISSGKL